MGGLTNCCSSKKNYKKTDDLVDFDKELRGQEDQDGDQIME